MTIKPWKARNEVKIDETFLQNHWEHVGPAIGGDKPPRLFGKALILRTFEDSNGKVVEHFAMLKENPASKKLALTKDGKVIAVRQYKQGAGECIEIPGGARENPNETPEQIASREMLEETGYRSGRIVRLGPSQYMSTRNSQEATTQLFLAFDCEKVQKGRLETSGEEIEILLIPWNEWIRMCHEEIVDPFSIVATFRAMLHLSGAPARRSWLQRLFG